LDDAGLPLSSNAVNISAARDEKFLELIFAILNDTKVDPEIFGAGTDGKRSHETL
jgi:hypothetical protein